MKHNILSAAAVAGLLTAMPQAAAYASHFSGPDTVSINSIPVGACGSQSLTFSGSANYSEPTQHLVVMFDGTELIHSHRELSPWTTSAVTAAPGSHTLTATIYDHLSHDDVRATASQTFTVAACGGGSGGTSASSSTSGTGGTGASSDCCPGPDEPKAPVKKAAAVKGQVKGATTASVAQKLPPRLMPINELFRKVYGRTPTFQEWEYWARRQWGDKPQYDALYGAMQWHKHLGHTTGGPRPIPYKAMMR